MHAHAVTRPRAQRAPLAALVLVAGAGWLFLAQRMSGMDAGPGGDPGALGWFAVSWTLMTVAMMLPASAPAALRFVDARPSRTIPFLAGYLVLWLLAGLAGYTLVQIVRDLHAGVLGWSSGGRYIAGAAVAVAGLYQLTDAKRRWLARCTEPDRQRPRSGIAGALHNGIEHGVCCVACCWNLMVALYALGMMSIAWMAVLTVLIVGERWLLLIRRSAVRGTAVALVALGLALATLPAAVPALTIPSKAHDMTMGSQSGSPMGT